MKLALPQKSPPEQGGADHAPGKKGARRKRAGIKRGAALAAAGVLAVGAGVYLLGGKEGSASAAGLSYTTAAVERRDITATITGSGTLEAANSYSVTSLTEGTILTADFEEGDQVEQGAVLYTIDSSDSASSLEQAQLSLEQAQRSYEKQLEKKADLTVAATAAGRVVSLEVEVGDQVNAGQTVATIRDSDTMKLEVDFSADEAEAFSPGQSASVTLDSTFETLPGTVAKVSANVRVLSGNVQVRAVTISVSNPGGLSTSQSATAAVGGVSSVGSGTFNYSREEVVTAQVSGEVSALQAAEGDRVSQGQTLAVLASSDLDDAVQNAAESLRSAQLSLEKQYDKLEDYTVTSPISGTVIDKNYKAGETAEANKALCTIYDLSYLTMTLSVDELDISNISVGQTVSITADAVEGRTYQGVVTKVSVAGTSSGGVTTYPVTIRIEDTDGLMPGMNVDATIVLNSASGVLAIPAAALQRGNTVLVTADSPSAANGTPVQQKNGEENPGYVSVPVTTGVGDDGYLEVTSGLQEGDTVAYLPTSSSNSGFFMAMGGGMPGGGGGMPSGGPGGPGGF